MGKVPASHQHTSSANGADGIVYRPTQTEMSLNPEIGKGQHDEPAAEPGFMKKVERHRRAMVQNRSTPARTDRLQGDPGDPAL
jgi:hypothetical protein